MTDRLEDCTFHEWLDSWFLPDTDNGVARRFRSARAEGCTLSPITEFAYMTRMFHDGRRDLASYNNAQLNAGLWELIGASGILAPLWNGSVPFETVSACLTEIPTLFREVFAGRCEQGLGHLDEPGLNPLNSICYMWWDIFPVAIGGLERPERDDVLFGVLAEQLAIPHDAVRESALHGLGHTTGRRKEAEAIIDAFLESTPALRPELRQYALNARAGCIQ